MAGRVPERQCAGCNLRRPKKELLRVVRTPDGEILLDSTGKKNGRGAYLCPDVACLQKARKKKALPRMLDTEIPESVYEALAQEMRTTEDHENG